MAMIPGFEGLEAEIDYRRAISSALAKIHEKIKGARSTMRPSEKVLLGLTWGELRALQKFGRAFYDE